MMLYVFPLVELFVCGVHLGLVFEMHILIKTLCNWTESHTLHFNDATFLMSVNLRVRVRRAYALEVISVSLYHVPLYITGISADIISLFFHSHNHSILYL
jgi:hypothetical protein